MCLQFLYIRKVVFVESKMWTESKSNEYAPTIKIEASQTFKKKFFSTLVNLS